LPHLFEERLNRSNEDASLYMDQFKNESVVIVARFVTFVSGSFAAILAIISLMDQALLVNFEITPGGSVLFYIGLFGAVFAAGKSMIPESHKHPPPEVLIKAVISEIHYFPDDWRDKLHTERVRDQFGTLFEYNLVSLLKELMSLAFGPSIFWFSLPDSSEDIIDFFREFTVHVDSLGYVCSFAVFDFNRNGNVKVCTRGFNRGSMVRSLRFRGKTIIRKVGRWNSPSLISRPRIRNGSHLQEPVLAIYQPSCLIKWAAVILDGVT
jgi:autophagy-related protein 9